MTRCYHCKGTHTSASGVYICAVVRGDVRIPAWEARDVVDQENTLDRALGLRDINLCDCGDDMRSGDHGRCGLLTSMGEDDVRDMLR
jgi:hypothetical protein